MARRTIAIVASALLGVTASADRRGAKASPRPLVELRSFDGKLSPKVAWSRQLACRRDHECKFAYAVCGYCPVCTPTWSPVTNRATYERERSRWAPKPGHPSPLPACGPCQGCPSWSRWLGTIAVCVQRQCRALHLPDTAFRGNQRSKVFHASGCVGFSCRHCTAGFASAKAARRAGYRPHQRCVHPASRPREVCVRECLRASKAMAMSAAAIQARCQRVCRPRGKVR